MSASDGGEAGLPGGAAQKWSLLADDWALTWDGVAAQVYAAIADEARLGPGVRLLDVGCGAGGLLAAAQADGVTAAGIDPAPKMVDLARERLPDCDIRLGGLPDLLWAEEEFDLVVSVNALLFAPDVYEALAALMRVCKTDGQVAIALWADDVGNDLDVLEQAAAAAGGPAFGDGGPLRRDGGLAELCREAGLEDVRSRLVPTTWSAAGIDDLLRAVIPGEQSGPSSSASRLPEVHRAVVDAAQPMLAEGKYTLRNSLYLCTGHVRPNT
ncbi:methyltransferase domain-containing protein [Kribbella sp. NPDC056861]|uniref:class I SAM-dependent methyltransferase n=1 Tax=Kribbella sp. NPDC056861 TaxID=3154857 RepID=UPI00341DDD17